MSEPTRDAIRELTGRHETLSSVVCKLRDRIETLERHVEAYHAPNWTAKDLLTPPSSTATQDGDALDRGEAGSTAAPGSSEPGACHRCTQLEVQLRDALSSWRHACDQHRMCIRERDEARARAARRPTREEVERMIRDTRPPGGKMMSHDRFYALRDRILALFEGDGHDA